MGFSHLLQGSQTALGKQTEIANVERQSFMNESSHQPVEQPGRETLERCFPDACCALAVNNIVSFTVFALSFYE